MNKTVMLMTLTAVAVMFASCRKDTEAVVNPEPSSRMTLTASIGEVNTKTMLLYNGKVNWNDGDAICVNGVRFVGTPTAQNPTIAEFVQADNRPAPTAPFHAFFPVDIATDEYVGNYGSLPDEQIYTEGRIDNVPMYAYSDGSGVLCFRNICGILAVKVGPGDIDQVASIRVSSTDEAMSGDFTVEGDSVAVLTEPAKYQLGNVVLICEDPVTINNEKLFFIAIPAQKYTDINIELSSDGVTYKKGMLTRKTTGDSISVNCGTVYTVDFVADAPTANCYIATEDTVFHIKACIGNTPELVGRVDTVKVLWESFGTDVVPNEGDLVYDVSYERGWITYRTKTASNKGNAVIAAFDEDGSVLWSWHIWLTSQPGWQEYNHRAGTLMDRNLGATSVTSIVKGDVHALGLLYQWGRKDPFLGADSIRYAIKANMKSAASTNGGIWTKVNGPRTSSYVIGNPTQFVKTSTTSGWWSLSPDAIWNTEKTIYDPCPVGWRVPDGGRLGVWYKAEDTTASKLFDNENFGFDFGSKGQGEPGYFTEEGSCWYPAAGCLNDEGNYFIHYSGSDEQSVGFLCDHWSCTRMVPIFNVAYSMVAISDGTITTNNYDSYSCSRGMGLSVRCQKIEE